MRLRIGVVGTIGFVLVGQFTLWAQHGNHNTTGHAQAPAPHVAIRPAGPNLGGRPYPIRTDLPAPVGLVAPAAAYTGISPGALRPSVNHSNSNRAAYGNFGLGYGGFYGLPYLPYSYTSTYYSFPSYSEQAEAINARNYSQAQDAMAQQLNQMSEEIRYLRDSQAPQEYAPSQLPPPGIAAPAQPPSTPEAQVPQVPIVLVLQNGAKLSVTNYAVMNNVIWDFSKQPPRKIPVSTVNVSASEKATQDNGGEFPELNSAH